MLKFRLSGQELTYLDNGDVIVGGTVRYLEAEFLFDEAWRGYGTITAYFKNGAALHCMDITDGKIVAGDGLNLEPGMWDVYIRAVSYTDDGKEIAKQITSSTVKLNALSHGRYGGSDFPSKPTPIYEQKYAEIVVAEAKRVEAENARNVFEEFNPDKTYIKGNKVSYRGSSYVLTVDEATGVSPSVAGEWLLIASKGEPGMDGADGKDGIDGMDGADGKDGEKGEDGTKYYGFPEISLDVGSELLITFDFDEDGVDGNTGLSKQDYPGIDEWRTGDMLISANGRVLLIADIIKSGAEVKWLTARCVSDFKGEKGEKGDKGDKGDKGEPGKDGADGKDGKDAVIPEGVYADIDLGNVDNAVFKAKAEEAGIGGGNTDLISSGGFKKIGFTSDCDYIATTSNGYTAFNQAVSEANDGDVIVVMPGTYSGSNTVTITKNIVFVGIGKPSIKFPINIGTSSQAYTVRFDNFEFRNTMKCVEVNYDVSSRLEICNSRFYNSTTTLVGTFSNCKFDYAKVSCSLSYAGDSSWCMIDYYDCDIANSTMSGDSVTCRNCIIRESVISTGYEANYTDCSLFNFMGKMNGAYQFNLIRCTVYGNAIPNEDYNNSYFEECYLVSGVAL